MKWTKPKECDSKSCRLELSNVAGHKFSYCTHCYKVEETYCENHLLRLAKWPQGTGFRVVQQCITCGQTEGSAIKQSSLDCTLEELHYGEPFRQLFKKAREKHRDELLERAQNEFQVESRQRYKNALNSSHWKSIRQKVLERDNHTCQACLDAKASDVHHLHYQNLGSETALELVSVCRPCHDKIHEKVREHTH